MDIRDFMKLLGEFDERFRIEIHAYCLMGNHYHLLVRTSETNLAHGMRHLDGVYTQRFHRRHGTDGPLFRGRYRAVLIQADRHLLHVSRYIHLNPVEAGLARVPEDWPHSSFPGYLNAVSGPPWLRTSFVLGQFGSIGARIQYRRFVAVGLDPGTRDFYGRSTLRSILGDDDFRERVRLEMIDMTEDAMREMPEVRDLGRLPSLVTVAEEVAKAFEIATSELDLRHGRTSGTVGLARGAFVLVARRAGFRSREIAAWIGYSSYACASKAAMRFTARASQEALLLGRLERAVNAVDALRAAHSRTGPAHRTGRDPIDDSTVKT
jgi:REP element-mobilizing transposase RayT